MYEIHMGERNTWKRVRARRSEREKEEESECEWQRYERREMRGDVWVEYGEKRYNSERARMCEREVRENRRER